MDENVVMRGLQKTNSVFVLGEKVLVFDNLVLAAC